MKIARAHHALCYGVCKIQLAQSAMSMEIVFNAQMELLRNVFNVHKAITFKTKDVLNAKMDVKTVFS